VIAGAVAAAAIAFVLHAFAGSVGLAVSSTAPTWRDASFGLMLLSGIYLLLVATLSYGAGAYLAGRVRSSWATSADEIEFRDGTHGVLVWALATLLTGLLALGAAQAVTRLAAPSGGQVGPTTSVAGENIIAYDLDRLFRAEKRPENADMAYSRAEAARILLTATGHIGVTAEDRGYLVRLVASHTGIEQPAAEQRVATAIASATENVRRARRSALLIGFMAGAAALLGLAVAWFSAGIGGHHRDRAISPPLRMIWRRRIA
jgi:hypothetical protein